MADLLVSGAQLFELKSGNPYRLAREAIAFYARIADDPHPWALAR